MLCFWDLTRLAAKINTCRPGGGARGRPPIFLKPVNARSKSGPKYLHVRPLGSDAGGVSGLYSPLADHAVTQGTICRVYYAAKSTVPMLHPLPVPCTHFKISRFNWKNLIIRTKCMDLVLRLNCKLENELNTADSVIHTNGES